MRRGDIALAALSGDYGKPRPVVIVQNDAVAAFDSLIVCPLTSHVLDAATIRVIVNPAPDNGLQVRSEVMTEKIMAVSRRRVAEVIGRLPEATMREVESRLAFLLGLG